MNNIYNGNVRSNSPLTSRPSSTMPTIVQTVAPTQIVSNTSINRMSNTQNMMSSGNVISNASTSRVSMPTTAPATKIVPTSPRNRDWMSDWMQTENSMEYGGAGTLDVKQHFFRNTEFLNADPVTPLPEQPGARVGMPVSAQQAQRDAQLAAEREANSLPDCVNVNKITTNVDGSVTAELSNRVGQTYNVNVSPNATGESNIEFENGTTASAFINKEGQLQINTGNLTRIYPDEDIVINYGIMGTNLSEAFNGPVVGHTYTIPTTTPSGMPQSAVAAMTSNTGSLYEQIDQVVNANMDRITNSHNSSAFYSNVGITGLEKR